MDLQDCYSLEELQEQGYYQEQLTSYLYLFYNDKQALVYSELCENRFQFKEVYDENKIYANDF